MPPLHIINDRHPSKHPICRFDGCVELTEGGSGQAKWCKTHQVLMKKAQQLRWQKSIRATDKGFSRRHVFSFNRKGVEWVNPFGGLWETGKCNRCGQTLLLERFPTVPLLTFQLKCVCCGQYSWKEVKSMMATEPLKQKLERTVENWGGIHVQRKGEMVKFCELSEAEQATILRSWLEQYVQEDRTQVGASTYLGTTDGA